MAVEPPLLTGPAHRRRSSLIKVIGIGILLLVLQVPLVMTHGVLRERQRYQAQAIGEIAQTWGAEQRVTGPVLAVPYTYRGTITRTRLVNGQSVQVDEAAQLAATAYFLPADVRIDVQLDPEVRSRGIYDAVVYTARLKIAGMVRPDFAAAGIEAERVDWGKARLLLGVSDLHGVRAVGPLHRGDGSTAEFEAGEPGAAALLPLAANPAMTAGTPLEFAVDVTLQGSGSLQWVPVGKSTVVRVESSWTSPSFNGAWLPIARRLSDRGFAAEWSVANFSRGFPQSWTNRLTSDADMTAAMAAAAFGVKLGQTVNQYSVVERAQKYGVLFFVLIFAAFFLFEVTAGLRIHPLQYAMVGAALCLFFLAFLALTEFWPTGLAYGVAAGACTAMVTLYSWTVLRSGRRTLVVLAGLAATYAYLYFVLKSEDYALIAGTVALFAVLALVMFFTRRLNWYALDASGARAGAA